MRLPALFPAAPAPPGRYSSALYPLRSVPAVPAPAACGRPGSASWARSSPPWP